MSSHIGNDIESLMHLADQSLHALYAESDRGTSRCEMATFRSVLKEVIQWARGNSEEKVATHAHWLEWTWFEREFAGSNFEDANDLTVSEIEAIDENFLLQCALLVFLVRPQSLLVDTLAAAAHNGTPYPFFVSMDPTVPLSWKRLPHIFHYNSPNIVTAARRLWTQLIESWRPERSHSNIVEAFANLPSEHGVRLERISWPAAYMWADVEITIEGRMIRKRPGGTVTDVAMRWMIWESVKEEERSDVAGLLQSVIGDFHARRGSGLSTGG